MHAEKTIAQNWSNRSIPNVLTTIQIASGRLEAK